MEGMAIDDGGLFVLNLSWMVEDDDLGDNHLGGSKRVVLGVGSDVSSYDILDRKVIEVGTKVVTW